MRRRHSTVVLKDCDHETTTVDRITTYIETVLSTKVYDDQNQLIAEKEFTVEYGLDGKPVRVDGEAQTPPVSLDYGVLSNRDVTIMRVEVNGIPFPITYGRKVYRGCPWILSLPS